MNKYNDGNWLGNLYTFDDRVSTRVGDETTHTTIGVCHYSGKPTDDFHNCRYAPCNAHIIADTKEYKKHIGFCSQECYEKALQDGLVRVVEWDTLDYKTLMREVKHASKTKEEAQRLIQEHITKEYGHPTYNHAKPIIPLVAHYSE